MRAGRRALAQTGRKNFIPTAEPLLQPDVSAGVTAGPRTRPMSTKTLAIKVFYGDQLVDTQTLSQDVIKIGKLKSSHVCLDDEAVARMHAVIEVSGDEVRVIDLGSATGTMLNGGRIDKNAVLGDGDVLTFGPYRLEVGFVRQAAVQAPVA